MQNFFVRFKTVLLFFYSVFLCPFLWASVNGVEDLSPNAAALASATGAYAVDAYVTATNPAGLAFLTQGQSFNFIMGFILFSLNFFLSIILLLKIQQWQVLSYKKIFPVPNDLLVLQSIAFSNSFWIGKP